MGAKIPRDAATSKNAPSLPVKAYVPTPQERQAVDTHRARLREKPAAPSIPPRCHAAC